MKHRFKNFQNFWRDFSANKVAVVALFIFSLILFVAIFAPLVSPTDPYDLNTVSIMNSRLPPLSEDFGGNYFLLGTDGAGRDMVSAIFYGLRVSLGVGVLSGVFALIIGSFFMSQTKIFTSSFTIFFVSWSLFSTDLAIIGPIIPRKKIRLSIY